MSPRNRWLVLAIVSSALFLIVIDMTVLYTALPRLTHDLAATGTEKLWIVNAYPLVVAGLLPGLGGLGDRVGHKRMFLYGIIVFGLASLAAAFSTSPSILIASRVVLAIGAAMMMPATLSLIRLTFTDEKERAFAIGIWAAVASGGAALGPVIGGLLLEWFWWGSVFLINVPVVLLAFVSGTLVLVNKRALHPHPFDLIGSVQVMVGLVGLISAVKEISKPEPSLSLAGLTFALGLIAMTAFVSRQRASANPLIDFDLFRNAQFTSGVVAALVASAALIGVELVFSQRLQLVLGLSPLQAGLMVLPIPIASFLAGPLTGLALPHLGAARVLSGTLALTGIALAIYILTYHGPAWLWLSVLAVMGVGIGATMTAASSVIMQSAPEEHSGMAASIEEVSFELGGALGIAILGSVMTMLYTRSMSVPANVPATAADSLDEALLAAEALPTRAAAQLAATARNAFDEAFVGVIALATILVFGAAIGIWRKAANNS
ncbi:MFS transporter [Aliiroseovarius sediminis]|uniref:MFS transporter n=1 Tax=Aliiroseovarius sediminis TaxID=2925839 RepID=UPI001F580EAF|nr:MFS transporter [Aliiroseovarius sediminis]MCI2393923.1 MFS transporter [Aliiroseovarius sediminis]